MGFFKNLARKANFYEPAKRTLCELSGIDMKTAHLYFSDYDDLFNAVIARDIGPGDGVPLVANFIAIKILDGEPHTNAFLEKYDAGIARKYDPLALSYIILKSAGDDYSETVQRIEKVFGSNQ